MIETVIEDMVSMLESGVGLTGDLEDGVIKNVIEHLDMWSSAWILSLNYLA